MPADARKAELVFLGEVHDNPAHHVVQAEWVAALKPSALVFEMIPQAMADPLTPETLSNAADLEVALHWSEMGWPDFAMYYPIFKAAPEARVYGASLPRAAARKVMSEGISAAMDTGDVERFALETPLPEAEQARREAHQMAAHCDALPEEMLPDMVRIQRVRDAWLARQALAALADTGGPVLIITGNGHARTDHGAPAAVRMAAPETVIFALGQSEDGNGPEGLFDHVLDAPAVDRPDPCAVFDK